MEKTRKLSNLLAIIFNTGVECYFPKQYEKGQFHDIKNATSLENVW